MQGKEHIQIGKTHETFHQNIIYPINNCPTNLKIKVSDLVDQRNLILDAKIVHY